LRIVFGAFGRLRFLKGGGDGGRSSGSVWCGGDFGWSMGDYREAPSRKNGEGGRKAIHEGGEGGKRTEKQSRKGKKERRERRGERVGGEEGGTLTAMSPIQMGLV